jgi:O-antigen/teichoic acid export membrane protein
VVAGVGASYVLASFGSPLLRAFEMMERTRVIFVSHLAATTFSMIAVYPLLIQFGLAGAVGGLIAGQLIILAFISRYWQIEIHNSK